MPDLDRDEARNHGRGVKYPELRRQADQRQQVIEDAELRVEHHRPHQRDRDRGRHHRQDEEAAQEAAHRKFGVKHHRRERAEQ
jgi:hypothetical protein